GVLRTLAGGLGGRAGAARRFLVRDGGGAVAPGAGLCWGGHRASAYRAGAARIDRSIVVEAQLLKSARTRAHANNRVAVRGSTMLTTNGWGRSHRAPERRLT